MKRNLILTVSAILLLMAAATIYAFTSKSDEGCQCGSANCVCTTACCVPDSKCCEKGNCTESCCADDCCKAACCK